MNLDQFNGLCEREWGHGGAFNDVIALHLTNESLAELSGDIANHGSPFNYALGSTSGDKPKLVAVGFRASEVTNPITRTRVKVTGDAAEDTAILKIGIDENGDPVTRTVTLASA